MFKLSPRHFVLPLVALAILASLPAAESGRADGPCGPVVMRVQDPELRARLGRAERAQSVTAAKICADYRNAR